MNLAEIAALGAALSSFAPFLTVVLALGALLATLRNAHKIQEVHLLVNSRLDQLLLERGESRHARGVIDGINQGIDLERVSPEKAQLQRPRAMTASGEAAPPQTFTGTVHGEIDSPESKPS